MRRLRYYIRLLIGYQRVGLLVLTQYPADTVIWIISMLLREASGFLGIVTIAHVAGGLGNWGIYEICVLYAMCAVIEAMGQAFFDNVWGLDYEVRKGQLDVMLVRPASIFVQLQGRCIHHTAVLSMIVYIGVLFYSLGQLQIGLTPGLLLFFLEFLVCGTMINSGIYTIFNCIGFWIVRSEDIAELVQTAREFAKYPLVVFPAVVKSFFTFIIPFGFVGFYPAAYVTGKAGNWVLAAMPVCACVVVMIASLIWRAGLSRYDSAGN